MRSGEVRCSSLCGTSTVLAQAERPLSVQSRDLRGTRGNGRDAPTPDLDAPPIEGGGCADSRPSRPRPGTGVRAFAAIVASGECGRADRGVHAREETAWRRFCSARSLQSPAPAHPEDVAHSGSPDRQPLWSRHGPPGIHRDRARTAAVASPSYHSRRRVSVRMRWCRRRLRCWYRSICTSPRSANTTRRVASQRSNASACRTLM
jgi:hypothetical protein